jgi:hypothetical protein
LLAGRAKAPPPLPDETPREALPADTLENQWEVQDIAEKK